MASNLYTSYKNNQLGDGTRIDLDGDTIKVALVADEDYTFSAAHTTMDDVTAYSGTTDQTLSNKTISGGSFDNTADLTFSSVAVDGTKDVDGLVVYKYVDGTPANNPLCWYYDLTSPVRPNSTDITVQFNASGLITVTAS